MKHGRFWTRVPWHRDLPYQNFVSDPPLALSALFYLDAFTAETGCTWIVPFSHREQFPPSESSITANKIHVEAAAASVILFDTMLFHRAGISISQITRRGVNHVYTVGVIRQQIDIPTMLKGKFSNDPYFNILLGYDSSSSDSVEAFRIRRLNKMDANQ